MIRQVKLRKKRPFGVTFFAVIYSWIGWFGGIAFLVMAVTGELQDVQRTVLSRFTEPGVLVYVGTWIGFGIWWLLYVVCGFLGFGLWRLREWSRAGVLGISGFYAVLSIALLPFFLRPMILILPVITGTILLIGWQFWYLTRPTVRYVFSDDPPADTALGFVGPPPPPRSGGKRNLRVLAGVLAAVALFIGTVMFAVETLIKNSVPYKMSLAEAAHSPCVTSALGSPQAPGWNTSGNLEQTGDEGEATLSIPIHGPRGSGTLEVIAERHAGSWEITSLALEGGNGASNIVPAGPCQ